MSYRVVHYINQFFANIGGEEMAHVEPELRDGFVGPGMALNNVWKGEAEIVKTVVCGDSYFAEHEALLKRKFWAGLRKSSLTSSLLALRLMPGAMAMPAPPLPALCRMS